MFQVMWLESALDELATIWMDRDSEKRKELTSALHLLEKQLRHDPENVGESRENNTRVYIDLPLVVSFKCVVEKSVVFVLHVRSARKRK